MRSPPIRSDSMGPDAWMWVAAAYTLLDDLRVPLSILLFIIILLLLVIIFLLWRQQRWRDFYVIRHLDYELVFNKNPKIFVTANRGSLIGGYTRTFSDFEAARAYFDDLDRMRIGAAEEVNQLFVVSGRKPRSSIALTSDRRLGILILATPHSDILARRSEMCEEHRALNHPELL